MAEEGSQDMPKLGDSLDVPTFEQILEMDDDEDEREFSRGIVFGFFDQAKATFTDLDDCLKAKDLEKASNLGHYLKGSSATIGLNKIRNGCEKIQHLGHKKDETGLADQDEQKCLQAIVTEVSKLREEFTRCERGLKTFYGE